MTTRAIVFGYDQFVLSTLDVLDRAKAHVVAVVFPSVPADPRMEPVRTRVEQRGHEVLVQPPRPDVGPFVATLRALKPDIGVVWSYPMILPASVLRVPRLGCVNLHPALLPAYRGTQVIQWTLINGEAQIGVTLHQMDEGIDTGPILAQTRSPIGPDDDLATLLRRSRVDGETLLTEAWPRVAVGAITAVPQDESKATYYRALTSWERTIDWSAPSGKIANLVRALVTPESGAMTELHGQRVLVRAATPIEDEAPAGSRPGEIVDVSDDGVAVVTGAGLLRVLRLEVVHTSDTPETFGIAVGDHLG